MAGHEYSVVGHSRSKIGSYIAFLSGGVAGLATTVAGLAVAYFEAKGWFAIPTLVVWPITGGAVFTILFILFDRFIWKWKRFTSFVGVPNISGSWKVEGLSYKEEDDLPRPWEGRITITQGYEKITVVLKTAQSGSSSVSAAIIHEGDTGYRLIYSYRNYPRPGEPELQSHLGHCSILFAPDERTAEGDYFNGLGRSTYGRMSLTRE